jgi:hypothetical protein
LYQAIVKDARGLAEPKGYAEARKGGDCPAAEQGLYWSYETETLIGKAAMEAISDMTWLRQLALSSVERFELHGFGMALVSLPPTPARHEERFRYRLLAFDPNLGKPVLSVDLESGILGDYCLAVQTGREHRVLARYDFPPSIEEFRERALAEAEAVLPPSPPIPMRGPARKRRRG